MCTLKFTKILLNWTWWISGTSSSLHRSGASTKASRQKIETESKYIRPENEKRK